MKEIILSESTKMISSILFCLGIIFFIGCNGSSGGNGEGDYPEVLATIGVEGGTVEVTDSTSTIYGAKVDIPEGTVENNTNVSISKASGDMQPPNNNVNYSEAIEIISSSEINGYVWVTIPLNATVTEADNLIVMVYDTDDKNWTELPIIGATQEGKEIIFATPHFSIFIVQYPTLYIYPDEAYTNFDVAQDCFNENVKNNTTYLQDNGLSQYTKYGDRGICSGLANFSLWYYFNKNQNESQLRCHWNEQDSLEIAVKAFDKVYLKYWKDFNRLRGMIDYVTPLYSSLRHNLINQLADGKAQLLGMTKINEDGGHAVVVTGYKKISNSRIEFLCYDVNYPMETKSVFCVKTFGIWSFAYDDSGYDIFFSAYIGDIVIINREFQKIKTTYSEKSYNWCDDSDGDGVLNAEDNCGDTPRNETPNLNGCSISQLIVQLNTPEDQDTVNHERIDFSWDSLAHPEEESFIYRLTVLDPEFVLYQIRIPVQNGNEYFLPNDDLPSFSFSVDKRYKWYIQAFDENDHSSIIPDNWDIWSFTTSSTQIDPNDVDNDGDGFTENEGDCDDSDINEYQGQIWYSDFDNDSFGNDLISQIACEKPIDYVLDNTDCDDKNGDINIESIEICDDDIDNDCNGAIDCDDTYCIGSENCLIDPNADFINSIGMTFNLIQPGSFIMGSPKDELGRSLLRNETQHEVTLTQPFYMQTTEVTQKQWEAVMGNNPSHSTSCGENCPVEEISWNDIQLFMNALNNLDQDSYRLPTEAEWEYAARAGSVTALANGNLTETSCGYDPNLVEMGWYCNNSENTTHPVASKVANAWGLYDMHGNVWEWCQDRFGRYPVDAATDPTGPTDLGLGYRVLRGGSYYAIAARSRSAQRWSDPPNETSWSHGFRLVLEP